MPKQKKQNENLVKIVDLLSSNPHISGNEIARCLDISRSAVWKAIKKLQLYNVPVISYRDGYVLNNDCKLLNYDKILKHLGNIPGVNLEIFETLESTNQYYLDANVDCTKTHICLSEFQFCGKGRLGRKWVSPFGQNICLSICTFMNTNLSKLGGLSLTTSLAIAKSLREITLNDDIKVKWPNDVIYKKQKLSGSLIQIISEQNGTSKIIIGVGVNVNADKQHNSYKDVTQDWCSIKEMCNKPMDRNLLAAKLIMNILDYLNIFEKHGFEFFISEWEKKDCFFNQEVSLHNNKQIITGIEAGVDKNGQLLISVDGVIKAFSYGETSFSKA